LKLYHHASKLLFGVAALVAFSMTPAHAGPNGLSGAHYNLNIQGKTNCSGDDLTGSNRHTIQVLLNYSDRNYNGVPYVELDRRNKIFLSAGDFQVLDGNACDSDGAQFQLPANVATDWEIWARALAKPGGSATMTLCGVDDMGTATTADDVIFCNTGDDIVSLRRTTGKPQWENVTRELTHLTACFDLNNDGVVALDECHDVDVFDPELYQYFWDYDNAGLRLAQLRFYPKP
jgi:hypothetical protein